MNLNYFQKIIDKLDKLYNSKSDNEYINVSINSDGMIYEGKYTPDSFDKEKYITLNEGIEFDSITTFLNIQTSIININKIDSISYSIKKNSLYLDEED